ncbi:hypothetical protein AB4142_29430, partial [Variovorax sp. 2RAF20]
LKSISSPENLWETGALLTQKLPAERFSATTRLDFAPKAVGERAGLVMFGSDYAWIGLQNTGAGPALVRVDRGGACGPVGLLAVAAAARGGLAGVSHGSWVRGCSATGA